jgi:hypothetical protein
VPINIYKDLVAGIVTQTSSTALIITLEVTTPFHNDEEGYPSQGLIEFDVSPLP